MLGIFCYPASIVLNLIGAIYAGYDKASGEEVAIKFKLQSSRYLHLENEYAMHKSISNHTSVPHLKWFSKEYNQKLLILSLLGPCLEDIFVASGCKLELEIVLAIAG